METAARAQFCGRCVNGAEFFFSFFPAERLVNEYEYCGSMSLKRQLDSRFL